MSMKTQTEKFNTQQEALKIAKLLANDLRLQILCVLEEGPATVTEIMVAVKAEQSRVSHQLSALREHQVISAQRDGRQIEYSLTDPHMRELLNDLMAHAEHVQQNAPHH
jgi:DNA-binding transcriptional ArsR family regulator